MIGIELFRELKVLSAERRALIEHNLYWSNTNTLSEQGRAVLDQIKEKQRELINLLKESV